MLVHQAETVSDLQGASFASLIGALQTRFDFPELAMFVVDGETVGVRVGGVVQPLLAPRTPLIAAPPPAPVPQPGVRVVETGLQQRLPAAAPAPQGSAPPPSRGVSMRGRPTGEDPAAPAPPQPAAAPPAAAAPAPSDKPDSAGGDDASARFSLLELD